MYVPCTLKRDPAADSEDELDYDKQEKLWKLFEQSFVASYGVAPTSRILRQLKHKRENKFQASQNIIVISDEED